MIDELDGKKKGLWRYFDTIQASSSTRSANLQDFLKRPPPTNEEDFKKWQMLRRINELLEYLKKTPNFENLVCHTVANISNELLQKLRLLDNVDDKLLEIIKHIKSLSSLRPAVITADRNFQTKVELLGCRAINGTPNDIILAFR